jgi:hypothetical protein
MAVGICKRRCNGDYWMCDSDFCFASGRLWLPSIAAINSWVFEKPKAKKRLFPNLSLNRTAQSAGLSWEVAEAQSLCRFGAAG